MLEAELWGLCWWLLRALCRVRMAGGPSSLMAKPSVGSWSWRTAALRSWSLLFLLDYEGLDFWQGLLFLLLNKLQRRNTTDGMSWILDLVSLLQKSHVVLLPVPLLPGRTQTAPIITLPVLCPWAEGQTEVTFPAQCQLLRHVAISVLCPLLRGGATRLLGPELGWAVQPAGPCSKGLFSTGREAALRHEGTLICLLLSWSQEHPRLLLVLPSSTKASGSSVCWDAILGLSVHRALFKKLCSVLGAVSVQCCSRFCFGLFLTFWGILLPNKLNFLSWETESLHYEFKGQLKSYLLRLPFGEMLVFLTDVSFKITKIIKTKKKSSGLRRWRRCGLWPSCPTSLGCILLSTSG